MKDITVENLKKLAFEIASEEEKEHGVKIDIKPMTVVEYYKSDIFKKDFILTCDDGYKMIDLSVLKFPFIYNAFYEIDRKDIIVFIKNKKEIKTNPELVLADFIIAIYHEIKHKLQYQDREKITKLELSTFMFDIELLVQYFNPKYYNEHHGQIFMEIEANLYGVGKTLEYLTKNNLITQETKNHLELLKKAYELDLKNYDFQKFLRMFNEIIMKNNNIKRDELTGWTEIFYNDDKSIKNIKEILSHEDIEHVDTRFLEAFFSSSHFLESVNFEELDSNYKTIILNSIKNTYNNELIRRESISSTYEQKLISKKQHINLLNDVNFNISYYRKIMYKYFNDIQNITEQIDKTI